MAILMCKQPEFTVMENLAVIDCVKQGDSRAKIQKELGIPESTMGGWLKSEEKYHQFTDNYHHIMAK